jgi:hypothetical protein
MPGVPVALVDPLTEELVEGVGEGEICLDLARTPLPDDRLPGRRRAQRRRDGRRLLPHR